MTRVRRLAHQASSAFVLRARSRSSGRMASTISAWGIASRSTLSASAGRNARSTPIRSLLPPAARKCVAARRIASSLPRVATSMEGEVIAPLSRSQLSIVMADIGGALGCAPEIDEERQIAAQARGVLAVEEEEAIAAEQILDVVLRRGDHHVDADLVEKIVQASGIEGELRLAACRFFRRLPSCRRALCAHRSILPQACSQAGHRDRPLPRRLNTTVRAGGESRQFRVLTTAAA